MSHQLVFTWQKMGVYLDEPSRETKALGKSRLKLTEVSENSMDMFFSLFTMSSRSCGPLWTSQISSLPTCNHSEQPETSFLNCSSSFPHSSMAKQATAMSFSCRCGHFGFWWCSTSCASNALELEKPFMPMWLDLTTVPSGKNARHSRLELSPCSELFLFCLLFSCVLPSLGRSGPARAEVGVGLRFVRLV